MGYKAKKTEHGGSKKGSGAYWGHKADAKRESNRVRRRTAKRAMAEVATEEAMIPEGAPFNSRVPRTVRPLRARPAADLQDR